MKTRWLPVRVRRAVCCLGLIALALVGSVPLVSAGITKVVIIAKESPTFGGYSWPGVGQYEKIAGKAFGELDPNDPKNAVIVDLQSAPRNASGKVEYSFDFYILKPTDLSSYPESSSPSWDGHGSQENGCSFCASRESTMIEIPRCHDGASFGLKRVFLLLLRKRW